MILLDYASCLCPLCNTADQHAETCELNGKEHVYFDPSRIDWPRTFELNGFEVNGITAPRATVRAPSCPVG